jgi:regulator of sigma E protease
VSQSRNQRFQRLGIIAAIILGVLLLGYITGELETAIDILRATGLVLIGITILVSIHELGHFMAAKAFGMRVEVFSIGFPPKLFSFQRGDTDYQIGATPLGGYVKVSGIIDESFDSDTISAEKRRTQYSKEDLQYFENHPEEAPDWMPKPWEYRSKPVWQRLIFMLGGVTMNVLLGIVIFSMMAYSFGEQRIPMSEARYGIEVPGDGSSLGSIVGFQTGDTLLSFKGQRFSYLSDYQDEQNLLADDAYYEVLRNGDTVRLDVPSDIQNYFSRDSVLGLLFMPDIPAIVKIDTSQRARNYPAYQSGVRDGDQIIRLDSMPIRYFSDLRRFMAGKAKQSIQVTVLRGTDTLQFDAQIGDEPILGVAPDYQGAFAVETRKYGFFEAFIPGTRQAFGFVSSNVQGIKNLTRPEVNASESVMGPFQIAKLYLRVFEEGGVVYFLRLTGMLSMILAFVNILPIPALDGGHVVFLLIEGITRRELSPKVRLVAQQIGFFIIIGLMLLILFNDAFRLIS